MVVSWSMQLLLTENCIILVKVNTVAGQILHGLNETDSYSVTNSGVLKIRLSTS